MLFDFSCFIQWHLVGSWLEFYWQLFSRVDYFTIETRCSVNSFLFRWRYDRNAENSLLKHAFKTWNMSYRRREMHWIASLYMWKWEKLSRQYVNPDRGPRVQKRNHMHKRNHDEVPNHSDMWGSSSGGISRCGLTPDDLRLTKPHLAQAYVS